MLIRKKDGLFYFQFHNLSQFPKVRHGIFTRHGGCSPKPFQSLNSSFSVGDDPVNVKRNRRSIADCFINKAHEGSMVYLKQIHSDQVRIFKHRSESNLSERPEITMKGDAVITELPHRYLLIQVADCQAVLFYDPVRHVVANVHSGWRGSVKNIIGKTVSFMKQHFMSNPKDIVAGIGPSLGPCCAEFVNYRSEIPENLLKYRTRSNYFDFWTVSRDQMKSEGIPGKNIETGNLCTRCRTDLFFSFRGEQSTGRFSGVIGILP